jgi:hypothetical protein
MWAIDICNRKTRKTDSKKQAKRTIMDPQDQNKSPGRLPNSRAAHRAPNPSTIQSAGQDKREKRRRNFKLVNEPTRSRTNA